MTVDPFKEVKDAWDWLLIQSVAVRNYNGMNFLGPRLNNPMLDRSILSLLTIALASFLDEALGNYISHSGIPGKKGSLSEKIESLKAAGRIDNGVANQLHAVRLARNTVAHKASVSAVLHEKIDWNRLDEQVRQVATALQQLGVLGPPQKYGFFAERSPVEPPNQGAVISLRYRYGVKRDGKEAFAFETVIDYSGRGANPKASD